MNQRQANIAFIEAYRSFLVLIHHSHTHKKTHRTDKTEENRTEQNRTEQNRTEQNTTEQNTTEQNTTEQNRTEQNRTKQTKQNLIGNLCCAKEHSVQSSCLHRTSIVSKYFLLFQLLHTIIKIIEMLKQFKIITLATTCFGSRRNHRQGAVLCLVKTTARNTTGSNHCIILLSS